MNAGPHENDLVNTFNIEELEYTGTSVQIPLFA